MQAVILNEIGKTSITFKIIKAFINKCIACDRHTDAIYKESLLKRYINRLWHYMRTTLEYSFFGRLSKTEIAHYQEILSNSKFIRRLTQIYSLVSVNCMDNSLIFNFIKKGILFSPIKLTSIILLLLISSAFITGFPIKAKAGLFELFIQIALIFICLGGLFCNARLEDIKKTSRFWHIRKA